MLSSDLPKTFPRKTKLLKVKLFYLNHTLLLHINKSMDTNKLAAPYLVEYINSVESDE